MHASQSGSPLTGATAAAAAFATAARAAAAEASLDGRGASSPPLSDAAGVADGAASDARNGVRSGGVRADSSSAVCLPRCRRSERDATPGGANAQPVIAPSIDAVFNDGTPLEMGEYALILVAGGWRAMHRMARRWRVGEVTQMPRCRFMLNFYWLVNR